MASAQLVRARTPVTKIERDNILATAAKVLAQMKSKDKEEIKGKQMKSKEIK